MLAMCIWVNLYAAQVDCCNGSQTKMHTQNDFWFDKFYCSQSDDNVLDVNKSHLRAPGFARALHQQNKTGKQTGELTDNTTTLHLDIQTLHDEAAHGK